VFHHGASRRMPRKPVISAGPECGA
jgi:hypothetical protein